ncbi:MAG: hypothetical protein ACI4RD_05580 [Kiritimatiellia bacterium]
MSRLVSALVALGGVLLAGESLARVPTAAAGGRPARADWQDAWKLRPEDFGRDYRGDGELRVEQVAGPSCNLVYRDEAVRATVCFRNETGDGLPVAGRFLLVPYTLVTRGDDVFDLALDCAAERPFAPVALTLPAHGAAEREIELPMPAEYGTCAVLFERTGRGRLFVGSFARIIRADLRPGLAEYRVCMDQDDPEVIARLRTPANRIGVPFIPSYEPGCEAEYARLAGKLLAIHATGYPVCVEFGAGPGEGRYQPLGRSRPHLTDDDVMLETKSDMVWLPEYDREFAERVKWVVREFGYPKGPVNALMLWNEPWAGISISGWGADDLRYREIYTVMCEAAEAAMAENPGVRVLLGGADSSSNTFDKLFGDGDMKFLKWLDFMSLHYQGLEPSNPRFLRDRRHRNGRTRFWDTESWVANSPDRVPSVLAAMLAAGHDRLVGIQGNAVVASPISSVVDRPDGRQERIRRFNAWPVAPALAAFQHFVGNREFRGVAWAGLPWLYEFAGETPEDLTYVVCGDIGPAIDGRNRVGEAAFWTTRAQGEVLKGTMTLASGAGVVWHDACGNVLARGAVDSPLVVTLDDNGTYLRTDGTPGSAARLRAAVQSARIAGLPSVAPAMRDATRPFGPGVEFGVELRNLSNREVRGTLRVESPGLELDYASVLTLSVGETRALPVAVRTGAARADNAYPFRLVFVSEDGREQRLVEKLHCNVIANASPTVDGVIGAAWANAVVQTVESGAGGATAMEKAWLPMVAHVGASAAAEGARKAEVRLAADGTNFYFAARVRDATPDAGMKRFATRDEDEDFYPAETFELDPVKTIATRIAETRSRVRGSRKVWAPLAGAVAFVLAAPAAGETVTVDFVDDDDMCRRHFRITLTDLATGRELERLDYRPVAEHSRLVFPAQGRLRVEIRTANWLKPHIRAVSFAPAEAGLVRTRIETSVTGEYATGNDSLGRVTPEDASAGARVGWRWEDRVERIAHRWPEGVRRYSYRRRPELPCGQGHDNVQIAFNVLPDEAKPWYPSAPGMFKGYSSYWDSDYVFCLNPVAPRYGGGTEVWRERAPKLPNKHYFPHAANGPGEGAVTAAKLVVRRDGDELVYEASVPLAEMPEVAAARREGRPIRFSCRINDNAGGAVSELSYRRSVARRNLSFKPDWVEHWSNELVFNWEEGK